MKKIRVGYQGIEGSNSEKAAKRLIEPLLLGDNVEFVPLVSSASVMSSLYRKQIDYGVMATRNSTGGTVKETLDALRNHQPELVNVVVLPIHHAIFKKNSSIPNSHISQIASHQQALKQCEKYLSSNFPAAERSEIEDTAIGAIRLQNNELGDDVAVICSREAGEKRGLTLIQDTIEDCKNNKTEFRLFKLPQKKYMNEQRMKSPMMDLDFIFEQLFKGGLVALILISTWFIGTFKLEPWATAVSISGYVLSVYFVVNIIKRTVFTRSFTGYWKYYPIPDSSLKDCSQQHHMPRLVKLTEENGKFHLKIFTPNMGTAVISAVSHDVSISNTTSVSGKMIYEYGTSDKAINVGGFVVLDWNKNYPFSRVYEMSGKYFGWVSKEAGTLIFKRISKEEFDNISTCTFLDQ